MVDIFNLSPKKIKNKCSPVRECRSKRARGCRGKFIKTHEGQENCLMCERLAPPALHIAVRQGEVQSNGNTFSQIESHFAEASVSTTGGSVRGRGHKLTDNLEELERMLKVLPKIPRYAIARHFKVDHTSIIYWEKKLGKVNLY